jgi:GNAT superfamily N-acetyltransferase
MFKGNARITEYDVNATEKEQRVKTTHRSYIETSGDFNRLCRFISERGGYFRGFSTWSLGRLVDWKYGLYENKQAVADFCDQNAHLWFDAFDDLIGFAISESGDASFAILLADGYRFLFGELLTWALDAWGDREGTTQVEITERQDVEIEALERQGFQRVKTFYARRFDLTRAPAVRFPLEEGFTIVDMHTHPDFEGQRRLRDNAFDGRNDLSQDVIDRELEFYNYSQKGPIYHPQVDLCVMAEDGQLVSGCEALLDARNATADIERVCTHSDFRRRGFARAVIQACVERLREMGFRTAYITGYSPGAIALYGSMGHVGESACFEYRLP